MTTTKEEYRQYTWGDKEINDRNESNGKIFQFKLIEPLTTEEMVAALKPTVDKIREAIELGIVHENHYAYDEQEAEIVAKIK